LIFKTQVSSQAHRCLEAVKDKKIVREIFETFEGLAKNPLSKGKALQDTLEGYRSIQAWRGRYRILYQVKDDAVIMVMVGKRLPGKKDDIYAVAQRLVKNMKRLEGSRE